MPFQSKLKLKFFIPGALGEERAVDLLKQGCSDFVLKGNLARLVPAIERSLREVAERRARREAEEALRESEDRYRSVVAALLEGVILMDADGAISASNASAQRILGLSVDQLAGRAPFDPRWQAIHEDGSPFPVETQPAWVTLQTGQPCHDVIMGVHKPDGSLTWLSTNSQPLYRTGDANPYAVVASFADITERRQAAKELKDLNATLEQRVREEVASNREKDLLLTHQSRLAAMGEMVHNIAHQWRQPLNALAIIINNIKDDYDFGELTAESLQEAVNKSRRLLERMSATIEDFRDFFRPDKVASDFALDGSVGDAVFIITDSLKNNDIELVQNLETGLIGHGYHNQFAQCVLNLLANAKEALQQRKIAAGCIEIRLRQAGDEGILTVQDNAGGIDEAVLPKIFDPYYSTKDQGSGIGLYMTRLIIERNMKGKIAVTNQKGGALFTLAIPLVKEYPD